MVDDSFSWIKQYVQDDALHFAIQGGKECGCGIFINEVCSCTEHVG